MTETSLKKLAQVLKVLVTVAFVCNLLALPLVPGMVVLNTGGGMEALWALANSAFYHTFAFFAVCWQALPRVWREPYTAVLAGFLLFCGANTAVVLWQARRVLDTVIRGLPFQRSNARSMRVMALCCALISLAALVRLVWSFCRYGSILPLFTYNALFVPVFAVGCLLCLVVGALFGQAAVLKEDSDLTI